jgi:F-box-like
MAELSALQDGPLVHIFSYVDDNDLVKTALICKRFHRLLEEKDGRLPFPYPPYYHPEGAFLIHNFHRAKRDSDSDEDESKEDDQSGYYWSCCDKGLMDPGCEEVARSDDEKFQIDNERRRMEQLNTESIPDEPYDSEDSEEWCDRHCHCGYGDMAYSYCINADSYRASKKQRHD